MDRQKVIKGLEHCLTIDSPCGDCPYYSYEDIQELDCERNLRHDALALLKDQEAKPMIENELGWNCRSCGMTLIGKTASGYPCDLIDLPEDEPIHFLPKVRTGGEMGMIQIAILFVLIGWLLYMVADIWEGR